jgi:hypothetical protein
MDVFREVKAQFSDEPIASGIVAAGEAICNSLAAGPGAPTTPGGSLTATPAASATPTPTP